MATVCLCLTGPTVDEWRLQVERNLPWIGMVELRIDFLNDVRQLSMLPDGPEVKRAIEKSAGRIGRFATGLPISSRRERLKTVLTCRRREDLGQWSGDETRRLYLLQRVVKEMAPDYVDLEIDRPEQEYNIPIAVRLPGPTIIRSYHDTKGTPDNLESLLRELSAEAVEVPKLAVTPNGTGDLIRLTEAVDACKPADGPNPVVLGMGPYGLVTRVFPARYGAPWTYASNSVGTSAAPGQYTPQVLMEEYRVDRATSSWPTLAVVGKPIGHSKSPQYHNRHLVQSGLDVLYLPFQIDDFSLFSRLVPLFDIQGASVTVPHKAAARAFADRYGERVRNVGVANTLVREHNQWIGANTDVDGFREPLREVAQKTNRTLAGKSAVVIGAGGAARAVVAALVEEVCTIWVANRTVERAVRLLSDFGLPTERALPLERGRSLTKLQTVDIIVQTTSVGMEPDFEGDPVPEYQFRGTEIAYDIIYTPERTRFLARAKQAGCLGLNGAGMFERQAERQFTLFQSVLRNG